MRALTILLRPHGPRSFVIESTPIVSPSAPTPSIPRMLLSATIGSTRRSPAIEPNVTPFAPLRHEYCLRNSAIANGLRADTGAHGSFTFG